MVDKWFASIHGWFTKLTNQGASVPDRWVMVDVETTGLNPASDRLLAIAAVALYRDPVAKHLRVALGDSFEVVLRQVRPSGKGNILIHHIGEQAQANGLAPASALESFRRWVGASPLLAYHASFDAGMIDRAYRAQGLAPLAAEWLDLEPLARLFGGNPKARALDDWLAHFDIECAVRHQAASDAFATAELLLRLWPSISKETQTWRGLTRLAKDAGWVPS